jgi:C-terminal processing protease CtpA/Prc
MVSQFARNPPGGAAVAAGSAVLTSSQQMASLYREKYHEPRLVYPIMKKSGDLGVRLVGGNAVGIFIHSVDVDSPAYNIGLRSADQILEYNGTDLR